MSKMLKRLLSLAIAMVMVFGLLPWNAVVYATDTTWYDASAETLTVSTLAELKEFANLVNTGTTFRGKTVLLGADLDLNNAAWTPIGNGTYRFDGHFDGEGHKISNLYINQTDNYAGLFGRVGADGEYTNKVSNLTLENVNVTGGAYTGAIIGNSYVANVTNCHVTGDIYVKGSRYTGGLTGALYGKVTDCTVIDTTEDGGLVSAQFQLGGVVGFLGEGSGTYVTGCTVKNMTVQATTGGYIGGVVGVMQSGNAVSGNTVDSVTVDAGSHADYATTNYSGLIAGQNYAYSSATYVINNVVTGSTGTLADGSTITKHSGYHTDWTNAIIGTDVELENGLVVSGTFEVPVSEANIAADSKLVANEDGTYSVAVPTVNVAEVNGVGYATLQEAINAANAGDTVTLLTDVSELGTEVESGSGEYFVQIIDKEVAIDLGGYTFTGSFYLNSGAKLTVDNGFIVTHTGNASSCIESVGGSIVLGEQLSAHSSVRHCIRIKGGSAVINGGTYQASGSSTYHVINVSHAANVTVNDGTFISNKGTSTVGGNALMIQDSASDVAVYGGSFSNAAGTEGCISAAAGLTLYGGTFDTWCYDSYLAEDHIVVMTDDGLYKVIMPTNWLQVANTSWYTDGMTEFAITTAEELAGLAVLCNDGISFSGVTIKLDADINLSGTSYNDAGLEWCPVAWANDCYFSGSIDGQNHKISNVVTSGTNYESFLGKVNGAAVQNLTLDTVQVTSSGCYVGGLIGYSTGAVSITNCVFNAITIEGVQGYAGGIVGYAYGGSSLEISGCKMNKLTIIAPGEYGYVGGLVGCTYKNPATFADNTVTDITLDVEANAAAGIIARIAGNYKTTITNCHIAGNIQIASAGYTSGIASRIEYYGNVISNCSVIGGEGTNSLIDGGDAGGYIGGIFGWMPEGKFAVTGCTVKNIAINAGQKVGGIGGMLHYSNTATNLVVEDVTITTHGTSPSAGLLFGENNATDSTTLNTVYTYSITDSTINGEIGAVISNIAYDKKQYTGGTFAAGTVTFDENGKVIAGTFDVVDESRIDTILADGYELIANEDGTYSVEECAHDTTLIYTDNGNGTHAVTCDCGVQVDEAVNHSYTAAEANYQHGNLCVCGADDGNVKAKDFLPEILGSKILKANTATAQRLRIDVDFTKLNNAIASGSTVSEYGVIVAPLDSTVYDSTTGQVKVDALKALYKDDNYKVTSEVQKDVVVSKRIMNISIKINADDYGKRIVLIAYAVVDGEIYYSENTNKNIAGLEDGIISTGVMRVMKAILKDTSSTGYAYCYKTAAAEYYNEYAQYVDETKYTNAEAIIDLISRYLSDGDDKIGTTHTEYVSARTAAMYVFHYSGMIYDRDGNAAPSDT